MTNEELMAKIKAEIERLIEESDFDESANLYSLLSFLSTLESEKPIPKDLEEYASRAGFDYADNIVQENPGHRFNDHDVEYAYRDGIIAGAKWQADNTPLPEDTVLFNKGVEEGKRLMMEEAVEGRVSYFESRDVAVIYYDDPKGNTMCFFAPSSSLETGDKVKIIIVKEDKK